MRKVIEVQEKDKTDGGVRGDHWKIQELQMITMELGQIQWDIWWPKMETDLVASDWITNWYFLPSKHNARWKALNWNIHNICKAGLEMRVNLALWFNAELFFLPHFLSLTFKGILKPNRATCRSHVNSYLNLVYHTCQEEKKNALRDTCLSSPRNEY